MTIYNGNVLFVSNRTMEMNQFTLQKKGQSGNQWRRTTNWGW